MDGYTDWRTGGRGGGRYSLPEKHVRVGLDCGSFRLSRVSVFIQTYHIICYKRHLSVSGNNSSSKDFLFFRWTYLHFVPKQICKYQHNVRSWVVLKSSMFSKPSSLYSSRLKEVWVRVKLLLLSRYLLYRVIYLQGHKFNDIYLLFQYCDSSRAFWQIVKLCTCEGVSAVQSKTLISAWPLHLGNHPGLEFLEGWCVNGADRKGVPWSDARRNHSSHPCW